MGTMTTARPGKLVLARKITARTDELATAILRAPDNLPDMVAAAQDHIRRLRSDAYFAHLDGKAARCRVLHREADRLAKVID